MKAITVSQPYASMIGPEKWVENRRRWPYAYRGPLAIHAGRGTQYFTRQQLAEAGCPVGCVLAVANLAAVLPLQSMRQVLPAMRLPGTDLTIGTILRHTHTEGPVCLILTDIRKLPEPLAWPGHQGLWDVPYELQLEIARQLEAAARAVKHAGELARQGASS